MVLNNVVSSELGPASCLLKAFLAIPFPPNIMWKHHLLLAPHLVFTLQPVSGGRGGELRDLVPLQLPHLSHHAGGQLVLDALALPGLQVSTRAPPAEPQGSPKGDGSGGKALLKVGMARTNEWSALWECRGHNWGRGLFWRLEYFMNFSLCTMRCVLNSNHLASRAV